MTSKNLQLFLDTALHAARIASKNILKFRKIRSTLEVEQKGLNDFVSEADRSTEKLIVKYIASHWPDHAILGEESGASGSSDYRWIIDPLDGTTNFLHDIPQFAVSIALEYCSDIIVGVVMDPNRDECFCATSDQPTTLNGMPVRVTAQKQLQGALLATGLPFRDLTHLQPYLGILTDVINSETAGVRRPGSAALDFAWLASGRFDGFWEFGLSAWDIAAGVLLIRQAGGTVSDIAGGEQHLQTGNVVAGSPDIHSALIELIKPHLSFKLKA